MSEIDQLRSEQEWSNRRSQIPGGWIWAARVVWPSSTHLANYLMVEPVSRNLLYHSINKRPWPHPGACPSPISPISHPATRRPTGSQRVQLVALRLLSAPLPCALPDHHPLVSRSRNQRLHLVQICTTPRNNFCRYHAHWRSVYWLWEAFQSLNRYNPAIFTAALWFTRRITSVLHRFEPELFALRRRDIFVWNHVLATSCVACAYQLWRRSCAPSDLRRSRPCHWGTPANRLILCPSLRLLPSARAPQLCKHGIPAYGRRRSRVCDTTSRRPPIRADSRIFHPARQTCLPRE